MYLFLRQSRCFYFYFSHEILSSKLILFLVSTGEIKWAQFLFFPLETNKKFLKPKLLYLLLQSELKIEKSSAVNSIICL